MSNNVEEQLNGGTSSWVIKMVSLLSAVLGGAAIWYTWYMYNDGMSEPDFPWFGWIRLGFMLVFGLLCLVAAVLLLSGKSTGWPVLKGGLIMIPLMLVSNLIILIGRGIYHIVQGNAIPFFERFFTQPQNLIIPIIVIALALLGSLSKKGSDKSKD